MQNSNSAFVSVWTKRPGGNVELPKISAIQRVPEWNWVVGSGVFIDDVDSAFRLYAVEFFLIGGIVLVGVITLAVTLARGIYRSIGGEPAYAVEVVRAISHGDLRHSIVIGKASERSLLAGMVVMQDRLCQMIGGIQQGAVTLGAAADALAEKMRQINAAARHSADATGATAAAIEEMTVSVSHISNNAKESERNSQRSAELAGTGESLAHRVADDLNQVSAQVGDASKRIEGLVERSREIGGIANVITEIADQTNLLALNAAIEAARAGEQGRGFAVVANEVRKLAERTAEATGQITTMIQGIQDDTAAVVHSMHAVSPQVGKGVASATEAAGTLHQINQESSATLINIREVANATAEQSIASNSIAGSVEKISQMIDEMAGAIGVANDNVQTLEQLAGTLRESVVHFKV